jgi:hypothetical protein
MVSSSFNYKADFSYLDLYPETHLFNPSPQPGHGSNPKVIHPNKEFPHHNDPVVLAFSGKVKPAVFLP